jgi:uncharacterized protein involved in oxidation of intracellular sulfur
VVANPRCWSLNEVAVAKTLFVVNDPPYGTERAYNALRLAGSLSRRDSEEVKVFLMGDAASCARKGQKVPQGYYNLEVMLRGVSRRDGEIGVCGTCMDARGISDAELADGTSRSTLEQLTDWTQWADKVIVF